MSSSKHKLHSSSIGTMAPTVEMNRGAKHTGRNKQKGAQPKKRSKNGILASESELKWKAVDIPDTLGDFGGFYGLEEIDGVDVKVIDGKVQFVAHDESKLQSKEEDLEGEEADTEFLGFKDLDDYDEGELSAASGASASENDDEVSDELANDEEVEDVADKEQVENDTDKEQVENGADEDQVEDDAGEDQVEDDADDELQSNVFNADVDMEDVAVSDFPEWDKLGPLSVTTLQGLSKLGFSKPTDIQSRAIPVALKGEDIMGKAATGSGKTLAYGIPILENMVRSKDQNKAVALIFTPTRELAQQVTKHLQQIGELILKKSPYSIMSLTGGLSIHKQERLLKYEGSARVIVATPGRFLELIEKDESLVKRFSQIDTLVLDEADRLLQDGHFDEFEKILKYLGNSRKSTDKNQGWQTMIFSATFAMDLFDKLSTTSWSKLKKNKENADELEIVLQHLMTKIHFRSRPTIIDTNSEQRISSQIKESLIECGPLERDLYCYYFVTMYPGTTLIFCNSIDSVKKLNAYLNILNVRSYQIHSSMTQKNRLRNLERYQQQAIINTPLNKSTVLIASDVAARGLDIPNIQHVIHYHLPRSADVYVHRSGRTARAEKEGVSVMICSPEESMGPLRKLRKLLAIKNGDFQKFSKKKKWQKSVPLLPVETDIVAQMRERSRIASEIADHDIVSSSLKKDDNWLKKAADELEIDLSSDEEDKDVILAKNKNKKMNKTISKERLGSLKAELNYILAKPLRTDLRKRYLTGGLVNLADNLVKKRGHETIIGHERVDALEQLKSKKRK